MSPQLPTRISITTNPTAWELYWASLTLIRYRGGLIIVHSIFPLFGLFLLMTPLLGYRLGPEEIGLAILSFSFTPLVTAVAVWSGRRRNKLAQGPFTYEFDAEGMHTSGPAFNQSIGWSAIPRVRCSKRFLFIFIAPGRVLCIPLKDVTDPGALDHLRIIAGEQTDFRC